MIRVCIAGATGWVGRSLVPAVLAAPDLELVGAVSRSSAGRPLDGGVRIAATVEEALVAETDVLVDYTAPDAVLANALGAIARGVRVVIGTSGVDDDGYAAIDRAAREHGVGVLAAGNFAISAVLLLKFAEMAARHMPSWEVIDYAGEGKPDAPSGTARELAHRLSTVGRPELALPVESTRGDPEARGISLHGTQVHSVRLPGYAIGAEVIFGRPDERLTLRYDGGAGAGPYVDGTLLAVRRVGGFVGLHRGLDPVLDEPEA